MNSVFSRRRLALVAAFAILGTACNDTTGPSTNDLATTSHRLASSVQCDNDNAGLTLPPGFCALVVADITMGGDAARARHLVVTPSGEIFVAINSRR